MGTTRPLCSAPRRSSGLRENQEGECALYHPVGSHLAAQSQWPLSCQGGPRHEAESHGHLSHRALTSASPHLAGGGSPATPAPVWHVLQGPHAPGRWPFLMHTQWTALQGIRAVCEHSPRDTGWGHQNEPRQKCHNTGVCWEPHPTKATAPDGSPPTPIWMYTTPESQTLLTCTLPRGQEEEALWTCTLVASRVHRGQEAKMTAQAQSTCSSVPWEQEEVKSSSSHDPNVSPNPQKPQTILGPDKD